MAEHLITGKKGETIALEYLRNEGFDIIGVNWRRGHLEIDIIAKEGNQLVIVEVKSRHSNFFGEPEMAVNKKKQHLLARAAKEYIYQTGYNGETRFDVIGILFTYQKHRLLHIRDAFLPGVF
jgi:putative endonuclease